MQRCIYINGTSTALSYPCLVPLCDSDTTMVDACMHLTNSEPSYVHFLSSVAMHKWTRKPDHFYSATALLAMQSAVIARGILSVCPSVMFRYCVQTNQNTIVWFSATGRTILLVSEDVKFIRIFAGDHPQQEHQSEALPCR